MRSDTSTCIKVVWRAEDGNRYSGNELITSISVPEGVAHLSSGNLDATEEDGVFEFCSNLGNVRLPESMRTISDACFSNCCSLRSLALPKSLRRIGDSCFKYCDSLVEIDIPSACQELGIGVFANCHSLKTVSLPHGLSELPTQLFYGCISLKSAKLPSSLKGIGNWAFGECSSLSAVNFESLTEVAEIGSYAFYSSSLTSVIIPPLVKTIEGRTFHGCQNLTNVELPPSVETIKCGAFHRCHPSLSISIPENVKIIHAGQLGWNTLGTSIRLPASLESLLSKGRGRDVEGLLQGVEEVIVSSRANFDLLVGHLRQLPERLHYDDHDGELFLSPDLKFKLLHCPYESQGIGDHIPASFFSFDISPHALIALHESGGGGALREKVRSAFMDKVSVFADILTVNNLPDDILHFIVPFIYGNQTDAMLGEIVTTVKDFYP